VIATRLLSRGEGVCWSRLLEVTGADPAAVSRLVFRDRICVIQVMSLPCPAATILKQCMLSGGADALVHREVLTCRTERSNAVVYGTPQALLRGCESMEGQPFGLPELAVRIRDYLCPGRSPRGISVNGRLIPYGDSPAIMGILNVTPDSFSDGGAFSDPLRAASRALELEAAGASIIDIGGESTRPGSAPVPSEEQCSRVIPVIRAIRQKSPVPISIDTTHPSVAREAVSAGAGMINSVNGLETPEMAETAVELDVPVCVMHMRGTPLNMQQNPFYRDAVGEVTDYLLERVGHLKELGMATEKIIVDPGIGFGKRLEDNLRLLCSLESIKGAVGTGVMLGHSRKSFLGAVSGIEDPRERDGLSAVVSVVARGADMLRVHDVAGTDAALKLAERLRSCV
jgi:dihydropteroate synthase